MRLLRSMEDTFFFLYSYDNKLRTPVTIDDFLSSFHQTMSDTSCQEVSRVTQEIFFWSTSCIDLEGQTYSIFQWTHIVTKPHINQRNENLLWIKNSKR